MALVIGGLALLTPALASAATTGISPTVTDGTAVSGEIGTLTESCPSNTVIEIARRSRLRRPHVGDTYNCTDLQPSATITWGDSTPATAATLVAEVDQPVAQQFRGQATEPPIGGLTPCNQLSTSTSSTCTFEVEASGTPHTYAKPSTDYSAEWNWTDSGTSGAGAQGFSAQVLNGAIGLPNAHVQRSGNSANIAGDVTYPNGSADPCDFTVMIDWGDGTTTTGSVVRTDSPVAISCNPVLTDNVRHGHRYARSAGSWSLVGSHTYSSTSDPSQDVSVTVTYNDSIAGNGPNSPTTTVTGIPAQPSVVTTDGATSVTQTSASLNGFVEAQESTVTDCHFDYGPTSAYGTSVPCSTSGFSDNEAVSAAIAGLAANTTYHYRVVVSTGVGTVDGSDQTLTTLTPPPPGAPLVSTGAASNLSITGATISGTVNTVGGTLADCHFEYGPSTSYGSSAPCAQTGVSGADVSASAILSGLTGGETYHYRLVASNPGSAASDGADASFTTLPNCGVQASFGFTQVTGCLTSGDGVFTSSAGTPVDVNGLTLTPAPTGFITIDATAGTIKGAGAIDVSATNGTSAPIEIYRGLVNWTPDAVHTGQVGNDNVTTLSIPADSDGQTAHLDGLPVDGDLQLAFNSTQGAVLTGNAWLPLPFWAQQAIGVTGTLQFTTKAGTGVVGDTETIQKQDWSVFQYFGIKNLKATYDPVTDSWSGNALIEIPFPYTTSLGASLAISHGQFQSLGGTWNGNIPIGASGLDLSNISFEFGENPTSFGGSVGISWGPVVDGKAAAQIVGGFSYVGAHDGNPEQISITGNLTVGPFDGDGASVYFNDIVGSGGQPSSIQFGGKFSPGDNPVFNFNLSMDGAIQGSKFDIDGKGTVSIKFINLSAGGEVLVSNLGIVGCLHLSAWGFSWSPGVGKYWGGSWDPMWHGCSVGNWQTLALGQASSASHTSPAHVALSPGSDLIEIDGVNAEPKVTLTGPSGHVSVPLHSVKPDLIPGFQVLQDPTGRKTWIAVQHGGGTWTVTPEAGSTPIAGIRSAQLLATPKVTGQLTASGAKQTLRWHLNPLPGEKVIFWEMGRGVSRVLASTTKATGSLTFTPELGAGGLRKVVADVDVDKLPRTQITVAHFTARAVPKPAKTKAIIVTGSRARLTVSWTPVAMAASYIVHVQVTRGDGAVFIEQVKAPAHSVKVLDANAIGAAKITVTAESVVGRAGAPAAYTYRVAKAKPKPKPKPKP